MITVTVLPVLPGNPSWADLARGEFTEHDAERCVPLIVSDMVRLLPTNLLEVVLGTPSVEKRLQVIGDHTRAARETAAAVKPWCDAALVLCSCCATTGGRCA